MQKKSYTVNFGDSVTVFPGKAAKKIIKGEATLEDIRVLTALLSAGESKMSEGKLCAKTGLDEAEVASAMSYWRGVGVITTTAEQDTAPEKAEENSQSIAPATENAEKSKPEKKVLTVDSVPKYSGGEISALLDKEGGKLRDMIDECQQIMGHMFKPNEVDTAVALHDQLGLDAEFIITLVAYCTATTPKCGISYIYKVAIGLVNDGINTIEELDAYIKSKELYDGVAGKLRTLLGIGGRAFTKKESGMINRWANDYGYSFDIIRLAYEVCCDANGKFTFDYASKVLENWYKAGVRTLADAEKEHKAFKEQRQNASGLAKSFDTSEFFSSAISRSYKNMGKKPTDNK